MLPTSPGLQAWVRAAPGVCNVATLRCDFHATLCHSLCGVALATGPGTSESEIVQLQHTPGRLMYNHRRVSSSSGGTRWQSFSDDMGKYRRTAFAPTLARTHTSPVAWPSTALGAAVRERLSLIVRAAPRLE